METKLQPCPCGKTPTRLNIAAGETFRYRLVIVIGRLRWKATNDLSDVFNIGKHQGVGFGWAPHRKQQITDR